VIRPVRLGDLFTVQQLGRQATKLAMIEGLLNPRSAFQAAFSAAFLWNDAKVTTYLLRRREHGLASTGLLQLQKRPGRPEAEILLLAPALDTAWGHPAIWQKLLAHAVTTAPQHGLMRLYADVPDQPLPVSTFGTTARPQTRQDEWALQRFYERITPLPVQQAEGAQTDEAARPPILDWWHGGMYKSFVLEQRQEIHGCVQLSYGRRGIWLQIWADHRLPDSNIPHDLVRFGLTTIRQDGIRLPIYVGVCDYERVLGTVLSDYGFAPFTDRTKMVKHVLQWVRTVASTQTPMLENVREVIPTPYTLPEEPSQ
jgi:hypothetical protein